MIGKIFRQSGDWAIGSDGTQWILNHRRGHDWKPRAYVRSTSDVLARCMREKGTDAETAIILLKGLPPTFREWRASVTL